MSNEKNNQRIIQDRLKNINYEEVARAAGWFGPDDLGLFTDEHGTGHYCDGPDGNPSWERLCKEKGLIGPYLSEEVSLNNGGNGP